MSENITKKVDNLVEPIIELESIREEGIITGGSPEEVADSEESVKKLKAIEDSPTEKKVVEEQSTAGRRVRWRVFWLGLERVLNWWRNCEGSVWK